MSDKMLEALRKIKAQVGEATAKQICGELSGYYERIIIVNREPSEKEFESIKSLAFVADIKRLGGSDYEVVIDKAKLSLTS